MSKFFKNLLKKIEEQNKETFGDAKLDCCDLNKKDSPLKNNKNQNIVFKDDANK